MKEPHATFLLLTVVLLIAGCQNSSPIEENERFSSMRMLKRLALGCYMYAEDNNGMLPGTMTDLQSYVIKAFDPKAYILVASGKLHEIENASQAILIRQEELLPDGKQAVAFVDGHAEIIPISVGSAQIPSNDSNGIECFMILAGKDSTSDGSIMVAHNLELSGREVSLIEKHPRKKHVPGDKFRFRTGLTIPNIRETYAWMVLRIRRSLSSNAVAINEHGVALAGGLNLMSDRNPKAIKADPSVKKGVCGWARNLALIRAGTAREAVSNLGELYTKYGNSYQCGVAYADSEEIWYIESGGGRSWAAVRVPDDRVWVQANAYRIGEINPSDTSNVMTSPNLLEFAREKELWYPEKGPFSFQKAFGGNSKEFNALRERRAMSLMNPSSRFDKDSVYFPMTFVPERKITLEHLFDILRDQETLAEIVDRDGQSHNIMIGSNWIIHSDVIQLRGNMPVEIGAVMWSALSRPVYGIYLPFYFGINTVPDTYNRGSPRKSAAHFAYKELNGMLVSGKTRMTAKGLPAFEKKLLRNQNLFEESIIKLYQKNKVAGQEALTVYVHDAADKALKETKAVLAQDPPKK